MAQEKIVNRRDTPGLEKPLPFGPRFEKTEVGLQTKGHVRIEILGSIVEKFWPIHLAEERQHRSSVLNLAPTAKQRQEKFLFGAVLCFGLHQTHGVGTGSAIDRRRQRARRIRILEVRRTSRMSIRKHTRSRVSIIRLRFLISQSNGTLSSNGRHSPSTRHSDTTPRMAPTGTGRSHQE